MKSAQAEKVEIREARNVPYAPSIERAMGPEPAQQASDPGPYAELASLCPLGAFDSGFGGLSVVADLRRLLPDEDIIYYGDNANCPYGGRSDEWLRARCLEITDFLLGEGAKAIVVACNTASAAGLEHLRAIHGVPIVGLVPAVKPAVAATRTGRIGVFATHATIRGQLLADVIERFAAPAGVEVVTVAPEGFVEAVERGDPQGPDAERAVRRSIAPMLERGVDAIVLGSTHYPFLKPVLRKVAGEGVQLIDSGEGVARQTRRVLEARHLLHPPGERGSLTVYTSGDPEVLGPLVWRMVGEDVAVKSGA
ncbi:MAG: glutamate racemase [Chloroflexia bacterium]